MNTEKNTQSDGWMLLTCIVAIVLAWNLIMAILGKAELAWWHYPELGICALFSQDGRRSRKTTAKKRV